MSGAKALRVCVLTSGHLATCPRMLKAATALAEEGHSVRVVSTRYLDWATAVDRQLAAAAPFRWQCVDMARETAAARRLSSGLRYRASRSAARILGAGRAPRSIVARGFGRFHSELVRAVLSEQQDLIYAGTAGALAAAAEAAARQDIPYALDLEDFHSAEQDQSRESQLSHLLVERIEREVLPAAVFLTAGSPAMAAAYARKYGIAEPVVLNNTFPLPSRKPDFSSNGDGRLRLYWFSQTLGAGRGLEDAVLALGLANVPAALHVRGVPAQGYLDKLRALVAEYARAVTLQHDLPALDDPIDLARGHDVGLALEDGHVLNRAVCRTNKSFTYMLAGLAVVFTRTEGQADLAASLGEGAIAYDPGDINTLALGLKRWATDRDALRRAREAAWSAAQHRWRWDHPHERGALLELVARVRTEKK